MGYSFIVRDTLHIGELINALVDSYSKRSYTDNEQQYVDHLALIYYHRIFAGNLDRFMEYNKESVDRLDQDLLDWVKEEWSQLNRMTEDNINRSARFTLRMLCVGN